MTDPVFQQAYENVRRSRTEQEWLALTPKQITEAIYQEIRRIDADRARRGALPAGSATEMS